MKVICFSDLHICYTNHQYIFKLRELIRKEDADVVVISGDIFDNKQLNPYHQLSKLSKDIPVICCLGNHEFAYSSVNETLKFYQDKYNPQKYNVHYLDIIGSKKIDNINFVGNVLWYDGSLHDYGIRSDIIDEGWLDSSIKDFNYRVECHKCIQQIENNLSNDINFLVTHCVPHRDLNLFSLQGISPYNTYSGINNLFDILTKKIDYAICGHTHRHVAKQIDGCFCVNIGNDYSFKKNSFQYFLMEV